MTGQLTRVTLATIGLLLMIALRLLLRLLEFSTRLSLDRTADMFSLLVQYEERKGSDLE